MGVRLPIVGIGEDFTLWLKFFHPRQAQVSIRRKGRAHAPRQTDLGGTGNRLTFSPAGRVQEGRG